jgi:hypothetical protein
MQFKLIIFLYMAMILGCQDPDWRTTSRESVGIVDIQSHKNEAVFQIYTARAFSWRKYIAIHPWIAWKDEDDSEFHIAQVTSWNLDYSGSSLTVLDDIPDRKWYGEDPKIIFQATGDKANAIIKQVKKLIKNYPYKKQYRMWPGPNSNTFVDYIIRNVREITVELPPEAIGKDYLGPDQYFAKSPGGSGYQFSVFGVLGLTVGLSEGIEFCVLGLTFGLDFYSPAIKLPFVGRVGAIDSPLPDEQ